MRALKFSAAALTVGLIACGDSTEPNTDNYSGMLGVAEMVSNLPKCSSENEGDRVLVKADGEIHYCHDGAWAILDGASTDTVFVKGDTILVPKTDTVYTIGYDTVFVSRIDTVLVSDKDTVLVSKIDTVLVPTTDTLVITKKDTVYLPDEVNCKTEPLADLSGVKIVCNGDSVDVVLNAYDVIENIVVKGVAQKGPYLQGGLVTLHELKKDRSLAPTGKNFETETGNDGSFEFKGVSLSSSYALLEVTGLFRSELGVGFSNPFTLKAYVDLRDRNSVNVNLLTHFEYYRVNYLMSRSDGALTLESAKKQAQKEIFHTFFGIDAKDYNSSEDLEIYGNTDGNAALLALSMMMLSELSESTVRSVIDAVSEDFAVDGVWDGNDAGGDGAINCRGCVADWALIRDVANWIENDRKRIEGWNLSDKPVPDFEKILRIFIGRELGLGVCGTDVPVGTVKHVSNVQSDYYVSDEDVALGTGSTSRFTCSDKDSKGVLFKDGAVKWRYATDFEKDTYEYLDECAKGKDGELGNGDLLPARVNVGKHYYACSAGKIREADATEISAGKACTSYNIGEDIVMPNQKSHYVCSVSGWSFNTELNVVVDGLVDARDGQSYNTVYIGNQVWMAENLNFDSGDGDDMSYYGYQEVPDYKKYGRLYTWAAAMDSAGVFSETGKGCGYETTCLADMDSEVISHLVVRGICPEGWHLPNEADWATLFSYVGGRLRAGYHLKSRYGWTSDDGYDSFGFTVLPVGFMTSQGYFENVKQTGLFWKVSEYSEYDAPVWSFDDGYEKASTERYPKKDLVSIRCVMDPEQE